MKEIKEVLVNNHCRICAFKHCGENYRNWSPAYLLEDFEDCCLYFCPHRKTKVYQNKKKNWWPLNSFVFVFPKNKYYNVVCNYTSKMHYYINISSKPLISKHRLGFIDYDIDFRICTEGKIEKRDEKEFCFNIKKYKYPEELVNLVREAEKQVLEDYENGVFPFKSKELKHFLSKKGE